MSAWTCDRCKQVKTELPWVIRTPFGPQIIVCGACYWAMRRAYAEGQQTAMEAQGASIPEIPENCEYRFLFALWYWHHRRGMPHSRLANRVVRQEAAVASQS